MAIDALVVDLDGTVWDSRPLYASVLADLAGWTCQEVLVRIETEPLPRMVDAIPGVSRSRFRNELVKRGDDLALYPTVRETIDDLRELGIPLAVATSLPGWIAEPLLDVAGLTSDFEAVAHASNGPAKPNPAMLMNVLTRLGVDPGPSIFVIGDDLRDAKLAEGGGVGFAWAAYGYGAKPKVSGMVTVNSFAEILAL